MSATWSGDMARLKFLLERGADVNAKGQDGRTVLMMAAEAVFSDSARPSDDFVGNGRKSVIRECTSALLNYRIRRR